MPRKSSKRPSSSYGSSAATRDSSSGFTAAHLDAILDTSLDAVISIESEGRVIAWNRRAEEMFGWSAAEAKGASLADLIIPPEHRDAHRAGIARFLATGEAAILRRRIEITAMHRSGIAFPVELTVAPYQHEGSWNFTGFVRDLTEIRRTERELARSERHLRTVIETEPDCVKLLTRDCILLDMNAAGLAMIEAASLDEVVGKQVCGLIVPEHRDAFMALLARVFEGGSGRLVFEVVGLRGTRRMLETHAVPLPAPDGSVAAALGITRDITESRRAEQVQDAIFRISQAAHAASDLAQLYPTIHAIIAELMPAKNLYIALHDADEGVLSFPYFVDEHDAPVAPKPAGRGLTEYVLRTGASLLVTPECHIALEARGEVDLIGAPSIDWIGVPLKDGEHTYGVLVVQSYDPGIRYTTADVSILEFVGSQVAMVIARRRTEEHLRHSQRQLRQSQRIEAVGRLAGGVAHDFNNLLTAILGSADALRGSIPPGDPRFDDLEEIRASSLRAADLTRQLLAFSRQQVLQPRVLDLNALITRTERLLGRLIGEHIELTTVLAPGLGSVEADPGQLEQVITNLVVNARDAMPGGGRITIETANADISAGAARVAGAPPPGSYVRLSVRDTGVGMTAEVQAQLFEPFFTTKPRGQGTGLGLATVYGIVRQSGATIQVDSAPGLGATFTIHLPRVAQAPASQARDAQRPTGGSETILVAEDEPSILKIVRRTLETRGYHVLTAASGSEAIAVAGGNDGGIELLLTDVIMPGMTGPEAARALLRTRPGLKVLYMSGYTDDAIVQLGVLEDGVAFIQKPFTPDELAAKVRAVLDR